MLFIPFARGSEWVGDGGSVQHFPRRPSSYCPSSSISQQYPRQTCFNFPDISSPNASPNHSIIIYSNINIQIFPDADGQYFPTGERPASPTGGQKPPNPPVAPPLMFSRLNCPTISTRNDDNSHLTRRLRALGERAPSEYVALRFLSDNV